MSGRSCPSPADCRGQPGAPKAPTEPRSPLLLLLSSPEPLLWEEIKQAPHSPDVSLRDAAAASPDYLAIKSLTGTARGRGAGAGLLKAPSGILQKAQGHILVSRRETRPSPWKPSPKELGNGGPSGLDGSHTPGSPGFQPVALTENDLGLRKRGRAWGDGLAGSPGRRLGLCRAQVPTPGTGGTVPADQCGHQGTERKRLPGAPGPGCARLGGRVAGSWALATP